MSTVYRVDLELKSKQKYSLKNTQPVLKPKPSPCFTSGAETDLGTMRGVSCAATLMSAWWGRILLAGLLWEDAILYVGNCCVFQPQSWLTLIVIPCVNLLSNRSSSAALAHGLCVHQLCSDSSDSCRLQSRWCTVFTSLGPTEALCLSCGTCYRPTVHSSLHKSKAIH